MSALGRCAVAAAALVALAALALRALAELWITVVLRRNRPAEGTQAAWPSRYVLNNASGLPSPSFITSDRIEQLANDSFGHRSSDIWVVTYPKSGTTWLQTIVASLLGFEVEGLNEAHQNVWCPWPERSLGARLSLEELEARAAPRCLKSHWTRSHHLAVPGRGKVIFVMRNAPDVARSYFHHHLDLPRLMEFHGDWDEFFRAFEAGDLGSGNYFRFVATWWPHRNDSDTLFLRYEELRRAPGPHVQRIAEFIGVGRLSDQRLREVLEVTSFSNMRRLEERHLKMRLQRWLGLRNDFRVREGGAAGGRRRLSSEHFAVLEAQYNTTLQPLGVPKEWALGS